MVSVPQGQQFIALEKLINYLVFPGISRDQCLSNPRCCYNSTFSVADLQKNPNAPWCFYKLRKFTVMHSMLSITVNRNGRGKRMLFLIIFGFLKKAFTKKYGL